MFANLKNGEIKVNSYRIVDATATTQEELIAAYKSGSEETLTAVVTDEEEIAQYVDC